MLWALVTSSAVQLIQERIYFCQTGIALANVVMNWHTVLLGRGHLVKIVHWDASDGLILWDAMMAGR